MHKASKAAYILAGMTFATSWLCWLWALLDGQKDMWNGGDSPATSLGFLLLIPGITLLIAGAVLHDKAVIQDRRNMNYRPIPKRLPARGPGGAP